MSATVTEADAEIRRWRERLAAASRNVSELSELPEFAAARGAAGGTGRLAEQARGLVATMDELWQGVLLIGVALDRAEAARKTGSLWWSDEAARQALDILRGASITVDLADTPVLHRTLLAGPRHTVTVSPDTLLQTMDAAFDRARESLSRITAATTQAAALHARLASAIARIPVPGDLAARLNAANLPDPLDRLDALEALSASVDAALAASDRARTGIAAARQVLAALQAEAARVGTAADACRQAVVLALPPGDEAALRDLAAWLDGIGRTLEAGRTEAGLVGLANWQTRYDQLRAELGRQAEAVTAALADRDELRARLGTLRAKHRARTASDPALNGSSLVALAATATEILAGEPIDLAAARQALVNYQAALAKR